MCGIAGYIGSSKDPSFSFNLISVILEKSEQRGIDASGYWGVTESRDILYHKEPEKASSFIKKNIWKNVESYNPSLLLVHARGASKGFGQPIENINNHPFVNSNKSLALIHNGKLDDSEYNLLKKKYKIKSNCDSELLLRILESGELISSALSKRLQGIQEIFSLINKGHMAVAIGERDAFHNALWLFRNEHRPLWVADARDSLGQIFFLSDPLIWKESLEVLNSLDQSLVYELPKYEVWQILDENNYLNLEKYSVQKGAENPWFFDGKEIDLENKESNFKILSILDEKDRIFNSSKDELIEKCDSIMNKIESLSKDELKLNHNFDFISDSLSLIIKYIKNTYNI